MKCTLLPQGLTTQKKTLIPAVVVFIVLALSACAGSNALATPAPTVTRTVTASPFASAKPSVKATRKAVAPKKPAAAAAPALLVVPAVGYSGIEPQYIAFSGDASNIVTSISWSSWAATRAVGTGTSNIEGCVPDCASGTETPVSTSIVLSDPVNGKFTAIDETRDGSNYTVWPTGAGQNLSQPSDVPKGLPATGVWFPAGFPDVACGPPTAGTNGLNTSYIEGTEGSAPGYVIDSDDPTNSPCNS